MVAIIPERVSLFFKSNKTLRREIVEYKGLMERVHGYDDFYQARINARERALNRRRFRRY